MSESKLHNKHIFKLKIVKHFEIQNWVYLVKQLMEFELYIHDTREEATSTYSRENIYKEESNKGYRNSST